MDLFDKLFECSTSHESLDRFLFGNMKSVTDFYNSEHRSIVQCKASVERFILLKSSILDDLDYERSHNRAFITILLDLCERLNLYSAIPRIYDVLKSNQILIGHRLQAALLYLCNIDCNSRLIERFEAICSCLQLSLETEEDNEKKVLATFLNFYASVIQNTPEEFGNRLRVTIKASLANQTYYFLQDQAITEATSIDYSNPNLAFVEIHAIIDRILNKSGRVKEFTLESETEILMETNTEYATQLKHVNRNFKSIRRISVDRFQGISDKDSIYFSLSRGVAILENEAQMYSYMNSYGSLHQAKMLSALDFIEFSSINNGIEIFDWSCGQGLATMVLLDYFKVKNISLKIFKIHLIEPSIVCLKRAALHIKTYDTNLELSTICSELDSIDTEKIACNSTTTKLHLFSNILDVETYSLGGLIEKIENTQSGINYFICVSPYITDPKADRIESFNRHFAQKNGEYKLLGEVSNGKRVHDSYWCCNNKFNNCMCEGHPHTCNGEKRWTRLVRVFKVNL